MKVEHTAWCVMRIFYMSCKMYSLLYISMYISILKIRKDWFSSNRMDRKLNLQYGFLRSQWFCTALISHIILWHWTHYVCICMVSCKSKRATHGQEKIIRPRIKVMYPTAVITSLGNAIQLSTTINVLDI